MILGKPKPTRAPKGKPKPPNEKKLKVALEKDIEKLARELCWWRDGGTCVEAEIDGGRCSNVIQWGHYIPRQISPYLVLVVGNTFCQCSSHNFLHHHKDPTFGVWYARKFGAEANKRLWDIQKEHIGVKGYQLYELEEVKIMYELLLNLRPSIYTFTELCRLGYYGDWLK